VHWQKALKLGVPEQKLRLLPAFREAGVYAETELTALELGEAVTLLSQAGVSQELWDQVELAFPSEELRLHLLYQIILMNGWNRLSVALALAPPH
jgi:alkylhydroperoxidase family enzyme